MPKHHQEAEPATKSDQDRTKQILDGCPRQRMQSDPHLSEIQRKPEEIQGGQRFSMDPGVAAPVGPRAIPERFHEEKGPGVTDGNSVTATVTKRWRDNFVSNAATRLLGKPRMAAFANNHNQFVSQQEAGKPRPPNSRGTCRTEHQMTEALVERVESFIKNKIGISVHKEDFQKNRGVLMTLFAIFKPEDVQHLNPRWVLNLAKANEPIQKAHKARKFGGGAQTSRQLIQQGDLGFCTDLEKGCNQAAQDRQMAKCQRCLVLCSAVQDACRKSGVQAPSQRAAIFHHQSGQRHVLEPGCLQFGHAPSREPFQKRVSLVAQELSQQGRIRSVTQADDVPVLNEVRVKTSRARGDSGRRVIAQLGGRPKVAGAAALPLGSGSRHAA